MDDYVIGLKVLLRNYDRLLFQPATLRSQPKEVCEMIGHHDRSMTNRYAISP